VSKNGIGGAKELIFVEVTNEEDKKLKRDAYKDERPL
jgi:hypothetical protein